MRTKTKRRQPSSCQNHTPGQSQAVYYHILILLRPCSSIKISFQSAEHAVFAMNSLQVDEELQANKITKEFRAVGADLHVYVASEKAAMLC